MGDAPDPSGVGAATDPEREALLQELTRHDVAFVLIGGAAIQSHGQRFDTQDVDVTPDADQANLERLAAALNGLDCRLVTDPADATAWVPLPPDYLTSRSLLAASVWNLATRHGQLDVTFTPSGFPGGYRELVRGAALRRVAGTAITVLVASLDDIHASKRAANRPKDQAYLRDADSGGAE